VLTVLAITLGAFSNVNAQSPIDNPYKFNVQDVTDIVEAKAVIHGLIQNPSIISCRYLGEEWFKIDCPLTLDRDQLNGFLQDIGYELTGTVYCPDGRVLSPPALETEER